MPNELCSMQNPSAFDSLYQSDVLQGNFFEGVFTAAKQCLGCGRVFFDPPTEEVLSRHYNSDYVAAGAATWYNVDADYATEKVTGRAARIVSIAGRFGFTRTHVFHEVGCAFGGTVAELNRQKFSTTGTDLSETAIADGRSRGNTKIFAEPDSVFLTRRAISPNVVYGYHVLEHMPDPIGYLRSLASVLAPDSIVILFVPNSMTLVPLSYGFNTYSWFYYPDHLNMYSPGSLKCLADMSGYELLDLWTSSSDLDPDRTARVIAGPEDTPVIRLLRDRMMDAALLHEELAFVLTPRRSPIAEKHGEAIARAAQRSISARQFEVEVMRVASRTPVGGDSEAEGQRLIQNARPDPSMAATERDELFKLRDENLQLRREREALSRAASWFARAAGYRSTDIPDTEPG